MYETSEQLSELGLHKSAAKLLPAGAVLVAMYGATAGRVGHLRIEAAVNQAVCALIPDPARTESTFLFHALRAQSNVLSGKAAGAAQQNLNAGIVKSLQIVVPDIATQRRIATVLSAFDELIELNSQRVEILNSFSRALYQRWFVHFHYPGFERSHLVESSLGLIPKHWSVKPLADVASITMGQSPKSEFVNDAGDGMPFHQGVGTFGPLLPINSKYCTSKMRLAKPMDILCSVRAPVGRLNVADQMQGIGRGLSAIRRSDGAQALLRQQLRRALGKENSIGSGTIYKAVGKDQLASLLVLEPDRVTAERFEEVVGPVLALQVKLSQRIPVLASARDLLLPRLVSGQLDISDIDLGTLTPTEAA